MSTEVAVSPAATPEEVALPRVPTPGEAAPTPESGLTIWASWDEALDLPVKARGEVAEMALVPKLMSMGLIVARPFGDSAPWDLLVQAGSRLSRLQVKSAWHKGPYGYHITAGPGVDLKTGRRRHYRANEIDFLVVYVAPEEGWFVIPVTKLRTTAFLVTMDPDCPFARYRDRWDLLYGEK